MPVRKYKTFQEAEEALWNFHPDSAWIRKAFRLFDLAVRFGTRHKGVKRGITRYLTFKEAIEDER